MDELINHLMQTPGNTNPNVIRDMLKNTDTDTNNNEEPDLLWLQLSTTLSNFLKNTIQILGRMEINGNIEPTIIGINILNEDEDEGNARLLKFTLNSSISVDDMEQKPYWTIISEPQNFNINYYQSFYNTIILYPPTEEDINNEEENPNDKAIYAFNLPIVLHLFMMGQDVLNVYIKELEPTLIHERIG